MMNAYNSSERKFRADNKPVTRTVSAEKDNVIVGDNAIIVTFFAYNRDEKGRPVLKNVVLNEVDEWMKQDKEAGGYILSDLEDVAKNGLSSTGRIRSECLTRPPMFKGKRIYEWKHDNNGGLRYYVHSIKQDSGKNYGKPIYVVLVVGDKTSQKGDLGRKPSDSKILNRYSNCCKLVMDIYEAIDQAMLVSGGKMTPTYVAHHNDAARRQAEEKNRKMIKRC